MAEWDAEEVKKVIEIAAEKIPALLNSLTDVLYSKDSAAKYGQAVANFYKTLRDSGMTDEQAYRLTEQYMSSLNIGKLFEGGFRRGGHEWGPHGSKKDE